MKICGCIAEYNPLHLGHIKHIDYIKNTLGAQKLIVIMSGNFTQRGEPAVLNKFTRAKQAIIAGADMVIELPTVFACGNAEVFAKGSINILDSLNIIDGVCFGVESGEKEDYISLAQFMNKETKEFKNKLKEFLNQGLSFAKARFETVKALNSNFNQQLLSSPNNILGIEYTKALLKNQSKIDIFPMQRDGNHNDKILKNGITSASSIREALKEGRKKKLKKNIPSFVYNELQDYPFAFEKIIMSSAITAPLEKLALVPDCTEGLENRIKALVKDNKNLDNLIEKVATKRYTETRIRRILTANLLKITQSFVDDCLNSQLYAKVLAVSEQSKNLISLVANNSSIPILTRKSDCALLKKTALQCFEIDTMANDLYNLATNDKQNENNMIIV